MYLSQQETVDLETVETFLSKNLQNRNDNRFDIVVSSFFVAIKVVDSKTDEVIDSISVNYSPILHKLIEEVTQQRKIN